jgi:superfamily II DNA or RNA helicase
MNNNIPARPCDIPNIPEKYTTWRPYQKEAYGWALDKLLEDKAKFVVLQAPTGSGKSLIAIALARRLE